MPRSLEDVLRAQLGDLIFQLSVLIQQNEALRDEVMRLRPIPPVETPDG